MPTATQSTDMLPIIDFGPFLLGTKEGKITTARKMVDTMKEYGFMYVINHGIPQDDQDKMMEFSRRFFAMSYEKKMKCPHPDDGAHHRGYSSLGKEKIAQMGDDVNKKNVPDIKESYDMGNENLGICNFWPDDEDIPGFKDCIEHYWKICDETTMNFLRAIAIGMDLPEEFLVEAHSNSENQCRLLHYPPTKEEDLRNGDADRISAHTDYGTITLLLQDECGGLEVEDPYNKGVFIPAPYIKGSLVVNTADCLQRWSNDTLRSTMHRVTAPPVVSKTGYTKERYSIPFFVTANHDVIVDALPGTFSDEKPKKYGPITVGDWMTMRMSAGYKAS